MADRLSFAAAEAALLEAYLPPPRQHDDDDDDDDYDQDHGRHQAGGEAGGAGNGGSGRPFVTLTFATSLDSALALGPGVRTRLSGPRSKAMTHHLRSRHDAILVGVATVLADDPGLNCRIAGAPSQPRPVVVDPRLRWTPRRTDRVLELARAGAGLAPLVLTAAAEVPAASAALLREHGGKYVQLRPEPAPAAETGPWLAWADVFAALAAEGLASVMVEGGGRVINSLLAPACHGLVNSVIVTIAPTWLGPGGVVVSPERAAAGEGAARLSGVSWLPLGEDVVLCGRLGAPPPPAI